MHNRHLTGCGLMLALALGVLVVTGGSNVGLGLLMVALICPLAMILGIKLLLGERASADHSPPPAVETSAPGRVDRPSLAAGADPDRRAPHPGGTP